MCLSKAFAVFLVSRKGPGNSQRTGLFHATFSAFFSLPLILIPGSHLPADFCPSNKCAKMSPYGLPGSKWPVFNASLDLKATNNENAVAAKPRRYG